MISVGSWNYQNETAALIDKDKCCMYLGGRMRCRLYESCAMM
jgi:hypothetical protein